MVRHLLRVVLLTSLVVLSAAQASPTHAQTSSDVVYEGTQEAGGPVRLVVSGDGAQIVLFEVEGVAGGGCSWDTITLANWGDDVKIADGRFSVTNADGDVLDGYLITPVDASPRIEGTIKVHDPVKGCETPQLRWVATVPRE